MCKIFLICTCDAKELSKFSTQVPFERYGELFESHINIFLFIENLTKVKFFNNKLVLNYETKFVQESWKKINFARTDLAALWASSR